ncbi:hypothetical protein EVAR_78501_1 [Eumeta japonica]|uniref:Uncharacterized protein n=1 Tax=Eumeta variegata TaxID=151549 RepID=A0A4C1TY97_EUMVA|nr:hypothetical protein EVAR_78501_1 [Eumeta japonica]
MGTSFVRSESCANAQRSRGTGTRDVTQIWYQGQCHRNGAPGACDLRAVHAKKKSIIFLIYPNLPERGCGRACAGLAGSDVIFFQRMTLEDVLRNVKIRFIRPEGKPRNVI